MAVNFTLLFSIHKIENAALFAVFQAIISKVDNYIVQSKKTPKSKYLRNFYN